MAASMAAIKAASMDAIRAVLKVPASAHSSVVVMACLKAVHLAA